MVWKSLTCNREISQQGVGDFPMFAGMLVVIRGATIVCGDEDEAEVRRILENNNYAIVTDSFFIPPERTAEPEVITVDEGVVIREAEGERISLPMKISQEPIPVAVDIIEEKMQEQFSLAKASSVDIVDEFYNLVCVSDASYYLNLRLKVFDLGKKAKISEGKMLTLAAKKMTRDVLTETMEHFLNVELPDRVRKFCGGKFATDTELDEMIKEVKEDAKKRIQISDLDKLRESFAEAVRYQVEREEVFGEIRNIGGAKVKLKKRLYEELRKISGFPFVETMWCNDTSFFVKVKGAKVFDSEYNNKEYFLGKYIIEIIFNHQTDGILKIVHVSTPEADFMHPHIKGGGRTICFGSQTVREGLLKMFSEFDVSLAVQVLFSFLSMYNYSSSYIKPPDLYDHWRTRCNWRVKNEER